MMREGRIKYYMPADYRDGEKLDSLIKAIIDKTVTDEVLKNICVQCKKENLGNNNEKK